MDYYEILGVDKDASDTIIKRAYKAQVLTCHPDKVSPPERSLAEEKFKLLTEAYQVLHDPMKRAEYDFSKRPSLGNSKFDIFDDFLSERDFFNDPFSHPFFTRNHFSGPLGDRSLRFNDFNDRSSIFDSLLSSSSRQSRSFSSGSFSSTSQSTTIQNGITKSITETRSGNNITREEIILNSNGQVISRTKTVNGIPVLDKSSKSFKIHIS